MYNLINTIQFAPYSLNISGLVNKAMSSVLNIILKACLQVIDFILSLITGLGANADILNVLVPDTMKKLYNNVFIPLGWGIAILLLMIGIFQFFFPFLNRTSLPAESILMLIVRFTISILLIVFLKQLIDDYIAPIFNAAFNEVVNIDTSKMSLEAATDKLNIDLNNSDEVTLGDKIKVGTFAALFPAQALGAITSSVVAILLIILVLVVYLCVVCVKFLMYHIEMLIQTSLWINAAPLAAGTFTSKQSSSIMFMWLKMLLKNFTCIIFNVIVLKLAQAVCTVAVSEVKTEENSYYYLVLLLPILCSIINVGKKISINIGQLFGINGMGDSIKDGIGGVMGTAMSIGSAAALGVRAAKTNSLHKQSAQRMERTELRQEGMAKENAAKAEQMAQDKAQNRDKQFDTLKHNKDADSIKKIDDLKNSGYSARDAENELKSRGDLSNAIDDKDYKSLSKADQDMIDTMSAAGNDDFIDAFNEASKDDGMTASKAMEFAKTGLSADDYDDYKAAINSGMDSSQAAEFVSTGLSSEDIGSFKEARSAGMSINDSIQTAKISNDASKINPDRTPQYNATAYTSVRQNAINSGISPQGASLIAQNRIYNSAQSSPSAMSALKTSTYDQAYNKAISLGKSEATATKFAQMKTKSM